MAKTIQFIVDFKERVLAPMKKISSSFDEGKSHVDSMKKSIEAMNKPLKSMSLPKGLNSGLSSMDRNIKRINRVIVGGVIGRTIASWGKEMLDTIVDFENSENRLKNVFGSKSAAKSYLKDITVFATNAKLPIGKVTEAFTELAANGNTLDAKQMQSLGDFAVFASRDITELSGAITAVSDVEKWQSLGISVAASGNKMKATFQGVNIEVDNTQSGALEMINTFAQLKDVQGASAKETEDVGRGLVGLSNNFKLLQQDIGEKLKPIILASIGLLSSLIDRVKNLVTWIQKNSESIIFWGGVLLNITGIILGVVIAMKAIAIGTAIINGAVVVWNVFKNVIAVVRTAMMLFNLVMLSNPIGIVIAAVAALVAALITLKIMFPEVYDWIVQWFGKAASWLKENFIAILFPPLMALKTVFPDIYNSIVEWFGKAATWVNDNFVTPIRKALGLFSVDANNLTLKSKQEVHQVSEIVQQQAGNRFVSPVKGLFDASNFAPKGTKATAAPSPSNAKGTSKVTKGVSDVVGPGRENKIINISIKSLVEVLNVHAASIQDRASDIKREVEKVLLEATNNINHVT